MGVHHISGSSAKMQLPVKTIGNRTRPILHSHKAVEKRARVARATEQDYLNNPTPEQRTEVEVQKIHLAPTTDPQPDHWDDIDDPNWQDISDVSMLNAVLRGEKAMDISHEGGEYELANDLRDKLISKWQKSRGHKRDFHKHRNHTQQQVNAFNTILAPMMDTYLEWFMERGEDRGVHLPQEAPLLDNLQSHTGQYSIPASHLSAEAFVHLGFIPCAPKQPGSIREQLSICYNVYIAILEGVEHQILTKLSCEDVDWHLKNCCSACTFELEGEEKMEFSMFGAMDSNNSLKRVPHSKLVKSLDGGRVSIEREDSRDGGGSYILSQNAVDLWSKEAIGKVDAPPPDEVTPCEECWKNMSDDCTSKMWNVFDEMGFFLSLCHHGSVLLSADMVRSGEQAKYPLAVISKLLEMFGLGLEDLKTLECFFSKSNVLAGVIQYASQFHHRQQITWYLKHIVCFKSFEHLNLFLCNNYRQALEIIETYPALQKSMQKWLQELERLQDLEQLLNISPDERWTIGCAKWIKNEQQHLNRLESLVISWIFKLTKMNMLHTGYKMRKHIGKALQARSKAIHTALAQYNAAAAAALKPPRPLLQWEQVVEYAFLSDFDLLCDVQRDMSGHKWATPAGHKAMDTYFKIYAYLQCCEKSIAMTTPALALQVSHYRHGHKQFYAMHMCQFYMLSEDPHFTGDISVGLVAGVQEGFGLDTPEDVAMDSLDNATMATDSIDHDIVDLGNDSQSNGSNDKDEGNTINEEVEAIMLISGDNAQE
ncbi:hypothetical protein IW262DRAFT_1302739 [Armillaria fumosa]|nr:hypothetical protein IW262DRAFT_1302739 [Armillaria fumosa]